VHAKFDNAVNYARALVNGVPPRGLNLGRVHESEGIDRIVERPASPAPRATYMRGFVKGRRVHAVVARILKLLLGGAIIGHSSPFILIFIQPP